MLTSITKLIASVFIGITSLFGSHNLGNSAPSGVVPAVFETYLASQQATSDMTLTIASGALRDGTSLSGYTCFTIDSNTPQLEYECGTVSGTTMTVSVRGIDATTGTTTVASLKFQHRRGADVKITDYPALTIMNNQLNGTQVIPAPLVYDPSVSSSSITSSYMLASKQYVDGVAIAGAAKATNLVYGITRLSTSAVSPTIPIAVGDNDNRVPTVNMSSVTLGMVSALGGSFGTPSATNTYLTSSDATSTPIAGRVIRYDSGGYTPGITYAGAFGDGSNGDVTISATTTLTSDMNYNNLTINSGVSLLTSNFRVFIKGTLTNNGTISVNGGNASGKTGGVAVSAGTLLGGGSGANGGGLGVAGAGGAGGGIVFVAAKNVALQGTIESKGGIGGNAASASSNTAGSNGTTISRSLLQSGTGGNGGNSSGNSGGTGGSITTSSKMSMGSVSLLTSMFDGVAQLAGGAGGASGGEYGAGPSSGGGGGGQGGIIVFIYNTMVSSGTTNVSGGTFGTGFGSGGLSGTAGSSGLVISIQI